MREITFFRKKNSTLSGLRVSVYAEAVGKGTVEINNTPCTFLGALNDGGCFSVNLVDSDVKLFFVTEGNNGSEISIGLIPAGSVSMDIKGEIGKNPEGNYVFGITSMGKAEPKKKTKSIIIAAVAILLICTLTIGGILLFSKVNLGDPKDFAYEELHITLTEDFGGLNNIPDNVDYALKSSEVYIWIIKNDYTEAAEFLLPAEGHAQVFIKENGLKNVIIESVKEKKIARFVYDKENPDGNETYRYHTYVYHGVLASWTVQFITAPNDSGKYEDYIEEWAESVKIIEGNNDTDR